MTQSAGVGNLLLLVYFHFLFYALFPSGSINVHGAFFIEIEKKKQQEKSHQAAPLIHFMLQSVEAPLHTRKDWT